MKTLGSRGICALTLSLIALADVCVILNIPVLRQVLGFALLTLLPGFLLIQILRITRNPLEKVLFLIGLSIAFLMFIPLLMNFGYPALGISRPISVLPMTVTISLILAGLSLAAYMKGSFDFQITAADFGTLVDRITTPQVIGAALILVLGILGALFIRVYDDSIFSLLSMLSIVIAVVLIVASRKVPERFYPLFILVIAIALQYSRTLASPNLSGDDVHYELYFADVVKLSGFWDPHYMISDISHNDYFGMLSVAFLPNVYSILLNIDTVLVYELIIPIIFAFVPIGLYQIFKTQIKLSSRSAFLSVFFFMSFYVFFYEIPRQEIAELFLVLVAVLIMNQYLPESKKAALLILFIGGMVVSHYATSYIFLFYLAAMLIASTVIASRNRQKASRPPISVTLAVLAVFITFGWYMFASGGAPYNAFLTFGSHTVNAVSAELFSGISDPRVAGAVGGGISSLPLTHALAYYWFIATEVLIAVGLVFMTWRRKELKTNTSFLLFSLAGFFILLCAIPLPSLAVAVTPERAFGLVLLFLAPCCVLAVQGIADVTSNRLRVNKDAALKLRHIALICVLVPYFLFNYGFIWEITEHPSNYAFFPSQTQHDRVLEYSDYANQSWSYVVLGPVPIEGVYASRWLSNSMGQSPIYIDATHSDVIAYGHISPDSIIKITPWALNKSLGTAYVYLGAANVQRGTVNLGMGGEESRISSFRALSNGNRVYSNGLAEVNYYS